MHVRHDVHAYVHCNTQLLEHIILLHLRTWSLIMSWWLSIMISNLSQRVLSSPTCSTPPPWQQPTGEACSSSQPPQRVAQSLVFSSRVQHVWHLLHQSLQPSEDGWRVHHELQPRMNQWSTEIKCICQHNIILLKTLKIKEVILYLEMRWDCPSQSWEKGIK